MRRPEDALPALETSLAGHAARAPDAIALVDADGACSYARLQRLVDDAVERLAALGVEAGDRVAVLADKRVLTVAWLLGAMRSGAVAVPVNPRLTPAQVGHVLRDSGASAIVGAGTALRALGDLPIGVPFRLDINDVGARERHELSTAPVALRREPSHANRERAPLERAVDPPARTAPASERLAALLYTSGSTADPKGVMVSASNLAHGADAVARLLNLAPADRILALLPLSFDYGLNQVTSALHVGARAVLFDALLPRDVIDAVADHRITGLPAVPHLWNRLARLDWPELPHLRYATNTGGHLSAATSARLRQALPHVRFHAMYGFTEAFRATALDPALLPERPESVGVAVAHARVLVIGPDGTETAPGETGELIQSGPLVTLGYWRAEQATRARFRHRPAPHDDGLLYAWSGDLFRRDADGLLYFVSRSDDVAKLHGYRVNPAEIERAIAGCPAVRDACVVCVPHPVLGEAAVAIVAAEPDTLAEIEAHCRRALPGFMRPERTLLVSALPAGPHGKVDRRTLQAHHADLFDGVDRAGGQGS